MLAVSLPALIPELFEPSVFVGAEIPEVRQHLVHVPDVPGGASVTHLLPTLGNGEVPRPQES